MSVSPKTVASPAVSPKTVISPLPKTTTPPPQELTTTTHEDSITAPVRPAESDDAFLLPPPSAILAGAPGTIMSNATEQAVTNANMPDPMSHASCDSGYYTGASIAQSSFDTIDSRAQSHASTIGPTRTFSMSKQEPKQRGPPPNQYEPRPSNETRQGRSERRPSRDDAALKLTSLACIPCRKKKIGCDLRLPGNDYDPPCQRCRSENIRCIFTVSESIANGSSSSSLPSLSQLACPHCSLVFLREDELRTHSRIECAEKHYVCQTCSSRFRRLNDLDRHSRIHTGERPHTCDICMRRFSRATTLTRHRQGPDGCAGRRADLGRRRLGSFQGPAPEQTTDEMPLTQPRYS